ncbi:DUF3788 family protein [Clostridium sporogenes]|jgi:hypothetical protein|uniref:DUF3788 family protein n=1 Tax=Clostridium TaxID=1485 RepID=UPI00024BA545|nr:MULTISPECIES: DUF3788 family protein [Clostridium]STC74612.1 Protein of uncharacterised function (DUF3788) [Clostridium botulinum]EHN15008.1 hypothetical protein IYC_08999 [Clostridium sporogenes PA 3679]MCW6085314.1 DUF3788 domain-containing protein [Clostridium sporogenes]MCW6108296.1 DUF3788 domain-containing protein [Clostridium sporogenes]MDU4597616.1 DUF3788 family protein [Clostridium sporogenes]
MDLERMYNKEPLPTYDEMRGFIGNSAVKNFDKIVTFIEENYDFNKEIHYGGKNYGVLIRFRRSGKTLLSLFPGKNSFKNHTITICEPLILIFLSFLGGNDFVVKLLYLNRLTEQNYKYCRE